MVSSKEWNMKRLICLLSLSCLLLGLSGCRGGSYERDGEGLNIVTTVFPAYDFVREIAGERANICLLVPPGSESHSFEPTAQDMVRIQECDLLVCNGGESEAWVETLLGATEGQVARVTMLQCVEALEEEVKDGMQVNGHGHPAHNGPDAHEEEEYDEHVWTSPRNAAQIAQAICDALCRIDGAGAAGYRERCAAYREKLLALDGQFRQTVDEASRHTLIFADRFPVRYFVEEYGLDYYAAFPGCADDAEPSARTVAFLIDKVRQEQCPAVLYIEFSNQKMADVICEDTGCRKLLFHSCHNVTRQQLEEGLSYLQLMEGNLETLREALS